MVDAANRNETEIIDALVESGVLKDWACTVEGDHVWFFDDENTKPIYRRQILEVLKNRHARALIEALLTAKKGAYFRVG